MHKPVETTSSVAVRSRKSEPAEPQSTPSPTEDKVKTLLSAKKRKRNVRAPTPPPSPPPVEETKKLRSSKL